MNVVAPGRWIRIRYRMFDSTGAELETVPRELSYLHGGYGELLTALESALEGKTPGATVSVYLEPDSAYGHYDAERIVLVPRESMPGHLEPGMTFEGIPGEAPDGRLYVATDVTDEVVVLDANHPLAGIAVRFELEILAVRDATDAEIEAEALRLGQGDN